MLSSSLIRLLKFDNNHCDNPCLIFVFAVFYMPYKCWYFTCSFFFSNAAIGGHQTELNRTLSHAPM